MPSRAASSPPIAATALAVERCPAATFSSTAAWSRMVEPAEPVIWTLPR